MNIDFYSYNSSNELYGNKDKSDKIFIITKEKILFFKDEEKFSYLVNKSNLKVKLISDNVFATIREKKLYQEEKLICTISDVDRIISGADFSLKKIQNILKKIDQSGNIKITLVMSEEKRSLLEEKIEFIHSFDFEFCEVFIDFIKNGRIVNKRYFDFKGNQFSKNSLIKKIESELINFNDIINREKLILEDGPYQIEFSPKEGGILIHELIGHFSEAQYISEFQKAVFSTKINVIDYNILDSMKQEVPFPVRYDDLGFLCEECTLFENGVYKGNLHSAHKGNTIVDKNGRKMIRMRNLAAYSEPNCISTKNLGGPVLLVTETGIAYSSKQGSYEIEILEAILKTSDKERYVQCPLYLKGDVITAISNIIFCSQDVEWNLTRCVKDGYEKFVGNGGSKIVMLAKIYNK